MWKLAGNFKSAGNNICSILLEYCANRIISEREYTGPPCHIRHIYAQNSIYWLPLIANDRDEDKERDRKKDRETMRIHVCMHACTHKCAHRVTDRAGTDQFSVISWTHENVVRLQVAMRHLHHVPHTNASCQMMLQCVMQCALHCVRTTWCTTCFAWWGL